MAVDALVSQFTEILASMAKEEVTMFLGAEDALRQLEEEMWAFSGVLQDAERRAFTDTSIRRWLADVKDLVYDADDIIDYSRTHAEKFATEEHPVLCYTPILLFFCKRLERIRKRESGLKLIAAAPRYDHRGSISRIERQTDPLLEPNIVGSQIEHDTSDLVGLLTREEDLGSQRIPVIAITGMGGVGKTTLAQKIYNHKTIKDSFRELPPMWGCVSQQYTDKMLLREIISCAGEPERNESFAELQRRLATLIKGKKFFLILDDVWDAKVWIDLLRNPLQSGAAGSKVLITTRQQSVAKQMGAIRLHPVHPLTDEQSWSLLCKLVFQEAEGIGDGGEGEIVEDIGRQIAKKCDGLPLAIKTIAGVLMTKSRTRREWEMILTNPAWSLEERPVGVMGVLYLSYQDLPLELKQCFIFCSLFPEDYVFCREQLTRLWVSEGFIAERGGDVLLEDIADDYYNELLSRSLLQQQPKSLFADEGCKMHDLLRSLAQFLAGDEYFVGDVSQLVNATNTSSSSSSLMKLRHLSILNRMHDDVFTQVVKKHESLRTLLLHPDTEYTDDTMDFLFKKLRCLRVIDFSQIRVKSLPKSVGNLIHLRYLNLSKSYLGELPETVGNLSNLQYLILNNCENLEKLPRGIAKLYKLRYLDLSQSYLVELPETVGNLSNLQYLILNNCESLEKLPRGIAQLYKLRILDLEDCPMVDGFPAGIGRLQHLNCLKGFVTNEEDGWCSLEELRSLSQLRTLTIFKLDRALRGQPRARDFLLKHLRHLRHLKLKCFCEYEQYWDDDEKQKLQLIFKVDLFPPSSLETFNIFGYFGLKLPSWPLLENLRRLELWYCKYLKQLPALGQLPNLDYLEISYASSVESIGPEFMGMGVWVGALAFPMLTTLKLEYMYNLVEWQWEAEEDGVVAMPRLEVLKIESCPSLRSLPGGLGSVTTLTTLSIEEARSLSVIENLHSLKVLEVRSCDDLTRVSNLPALQAMQVRHRNALREVEGLYSLQSLYIFNIEMKSLPGWLLLKQGQPAFPMLKSLTIIVERNVQVFHRCLVDGPDWPKIQHYPQVDVRAFGGHFVLYTKDPFTFTTKLPRS